MLRVFLRVPSRTSTPRDEGQMPLNFIEKHNPGCLLGGKLNWILISFPNGNNLTQTRQSLLSPPQTVAKGFCADFSHWGTKEDR